jgi:hypothetical protein
MSPKDYHYVKHHHRQMVKEARANLATNPKKPSLRNKLAKELLLLRSLRKHHDLNQYLA